MLWTMYTALIGVFLLQYSSRKGYEPQVMMVFGMIELSLLLMLVVKDPFIYVWETWKGQVNAGFVPADGRGLNPLLQNYWMVIHPQVLFSGFSAMGVPFAYAVAAMLKRDYAHWIRPATPWIVFGSLMLGTGIIMGGFWAYETLGWGGYWAWDPVENSSLVPWLFSIASIHTILSQRKSGAFVRTNLALGMLCFIMVLYSTFLTRSGVLGETSVHSFVEPGNLVYWMLVGVLVFFTMFGFGLLFVRMREMPRTSVRHTYWSREFALFLGAVALVCSAVFIIVGTSSPLITGILQGKVTAVDISYYSTTVLPLGIVIALLTGIGQLMWWTRSNRHDLLRSLIAPGIAAVISILALIPIGIHDWKITLFVAGASFALVANIVVGARIIRGNPKYAGGAIAHIGLALMFFGFVSTSIYDAKETVSLVKDKPVDVLGYTLRYAGYHPIEGEKFAFNVEIRKDGRSYTLAPIMYYSKYNEGLMRNPDIVNLVTKDFYVAPLSLEEPGSATTAGMKTLTFKKGETQQVGDAEVTFVDFDFPVMEKAAMLENKQVRIGATLEVKEKGKKAETVVPAQIVNQGQMTAQPARYAGKFEFSIVRLKPDRENKENSSVEIGFTDLSAVPAGKTDEEVLVVEASVKPYINFVWSGVIVMLLGLGITIVRRSQEARLREMTA